MIDSVQLISKYLLCIEVTVIIILFLFELKLLKWILAKIDNIYEEILTHPKQKEIYHIFGDTIYMVGGSITGAGIYEYFANNRKLTFVIILGIILIISGAIIRENNRKGKLWF